MRWAAGLLLAVTLGGCASVRPGPEAPGANAEAAWERHRVALQQLPGWAATGRVVVRQGGEGFSASLRWRQQAGAYVLRVMAPLAQGTWQLSGAPGIARMQGPDGQAVEAGDPESMMREALGWSLPVAGARYWVLGIPDPAQAITLRELDAQGRLARLEQAGWTVQVQEYTEVGEYLLPRRLQISRDGIDIRLAISRWEPATS